MSMNESGFMELYSFRVLQDRTPGTVDREVIQWTERDFICS